MFANRRFADRERIVGLGESGFEYSGSSFRKIFSQLNGTFDNGERITLKSLYTISLDSLHQLDDAKALEFFRCGYLQLAYLLANSLKQFHSLAQLRNQRISNLN